MIPLFLGLTAANLLLLSVVFVLGLLTVGAEGKVTGMYVYHVSLGLAATLMMALVHMSVFTYFLATTKWLVAASERGPLDQARIVRPALGRKHRSFVLVIAAVGVGMMTMFAGAGADPTTYRSWWPAEVHLVMAVIVIIVNLVCAVVQYGLIRAQGRLIDEVAEMLSARPHTDPNAPDGAPADAKGTSTNTSAEHT